MSWVEKRNTYLFVYLNDHDLSKFQELEQQSWESYLQAIVIINVQVKMLANSPPVNHLKEKLKNKIV